MKVMIRTNTHSTLKLYEEFLYNDINHPPISIISTIYNGVDATVHTTEQLTHTTGFSKKAEGVRTLSEFE